jgi:Uri superfamily endonuclease
MFPGGSVFTSRMNTTNLEMSILWSSGSNKELLKSAKHKVTKISIPKKPGIYALHLNLTNLKRLQIGRLGVFTFPPGDYVYVGSALGPGGLLGRVGRHFRGNKKLHWHIDWLGEVASLFGCCYAITDKRMECQWSQILADCQDAFIPARRFGASDCRTRKIPCATHLVLLRTGVNADRLRKILASGSELPLEYYPFTSDSKAGLGHME